MCAKMHKKHPLYVLLLALARNLREKVLILSPKSEGMIHTLNLNPKKGTSPGSFSGYDTESQIQTSCPFKSIPTAVPQVK